MLSGQFDERAPPAVVALHGRQPGGDAASGVEQGVGLAKTREGGGKETIKMKTQLKNDKKRNETKRKKL